MHDQHAEPADTRAALITPGADAAVAPVNVWARRMARLQDLYVAAVEESDPLRAGLRAATADLLEIACRLKTAVATATGTAPTLETCAEALPAVDKIALLYRQAARFVQLDRDWAAERALPEGPPARPPALARPGETTR